MSSTSTSPVITWSLNLLKLYFFLVFVKKAYTIRLHAIQEYGLVIHEVRKEGWGGGGGVRSDLILPLLNN